MDKIAKLILERFETNFSDLTEWCTVLDVLSWVGVFMPVSVFLMLVMLVGRDKFPWKTSVISKKRLWRVSVLGGFLLSVLFVAYTAKVLIEIDETTSDLKKSSDRFVSSANRYQILALGDPELAAALVEGLSPKELMEMGFEMVVKTSPVKCFMSRQQEWSTVLPFLPASILNDDEARLTWFFVVISLFAFLALWCMGTTLILVPGYLFNWVWHPNE